MSQQTKQPSCGSSPPTVPNYKPEQGKHWVLANKKTGRVSSSNDWLVRLAAIAVTTGDTGGIAALLPQSKARKLLAKNELVLRVKRGVRSKPIREELREQAKLFIPALAVLWGRETPKHRPPRRGEFCRWIVKSLQDPTTRAYKEAVRRQYNGLLSQTGCRWWLAQLEKMQS